MKLASFVGATSCGGLVFVDETAEETTLSAGLDHERRLYELSMATEDRIEGMDAFLEKRKPQFKGR